MTFSATCQPDRLNHEHRCQALHKTTRERCKKYAVRGSKFCVQHGGRLKGRIKPQNKVMSREFMSAGYLQHVGPTLKKQLEHFLSKPHDEQVSLYEELAVARATATQALKLASPLFEDQTNATPEMKKLLNDPAFKALALSTLNDAMGRVKDLVVAASKIEKDAEDKVSVKVINLFILQILRAIESVVGDDRELLMKINDAIDTQVKMPLNDKSDAIINIDINPLKLPNAPKQIESVVA